MHSIGEISVLWLLVGAGVFGGLWGSFFNVAIYRWPREMSVMRPASHCPACQVAIPWYLNVPVLGYLVMRGRARCCGAPVPVRYLCVELLAAALCTALAYRHVLMVPASDALLPALGVTLFYFVLAGALVVSTFVDFEWMEIPDEASLGGTALALALSGLVPGADPAEAALGAGVGFLIIQVPFVWLYAQATGRPGMGEGDAKLVMMIGAFLGWKGAVFALVAGSVQGLLAVAVARLAGVALRPDLQPPSDLQPPPELTGSEAKPPSPGPDLDPDPALHPEDREAAALPAEPASTHEDSGDDLSAAESDGAQPLYEGFDPGPRAVVFGPLLALAALEYLFFGEAVITWYMRLVGLDL